MNSSEEPPKITDSAHYTHKTKEDFLRWLKKQKALKKQPDEPDEQAEQSARWR
jgi:hypothetical protein